MTKTATTMIANTGGSNLAPMVDQLGDLKAKIADLEAQAKKLTDELKALGPGTYEGKLFKAVVSDSEREQVDVAALKEKVSAQFLRAHTTTQPVRTLRTFAR